MNALASIKSFFMGDHEPNDPHHNKGVPRHKWVSYFDTLTADQKRAVLAYDGDDTVGRPETADIAPKA